MSSTNIEALVEKDQVRLLLAIVEARSFGAAADKLGITASSISQQVKRLEGLAGFQLFRRNRRGVEPTSGCEIVVSYAKTMAKIREDMKGHFQCLTTSQKFCIGMGEDFCRTALPSFLGLLQVHFPAIELRVLSGSYDMLAEAVDARSIDIAVTRRWNRFPQARTLWRNEQVWYGHARYKTVVADPIPLVVPCHPNPLRQTILDALKANGRTWEIRYEGVGLAGIEAAIRGGLGLCAGPCAMPMYGSNDVGAGSGLPPLPEVEFVISGPLRPNNESRGVGCDAAAEPGGRRLRQCEDRRCSGCLTA